MEGDWGSANLVGQLMLYLTGVAFTRLKTLLSTSRNPTPTLILGIFLDNWKVYIVNNNVVIAPCVRIKDEKWLMHVARERQLVDVVHNSLL